MKKGTLIIWVIIFIFIGLLIGQNQEFFFKDEPTVINLNIPVIGEHSSPPMHNWVLFLIFFFAGIIIAYLFNFSARFKTSLTGRWVFWANSTASTLMPF